MKKIKMLVAAAFVCAVGFTSYTAYDEATMTDAERMMQANIDALTGSADGDCYNGGIGSTGCSIDAGITIVGQGVSVACSVTCSDGYYSCCGIKCTCKSNATLEITTRY